MQKYHESSFQNPFPSREMRDPPLVSKSKPLQPIYRPPFFMANAASFISCLMGTILFFISFGGTAWYVVPEAYTIVPKTFGLWRLCVRSDCVVDMTNDYMVKKYLVSDETPNPDVIHAFENYLMPIKVLMCIAVLFMIITVTTNVAFITGFPTFFIEAVAQLFCGVLVATAVAMFGSEFHDKDHEAPFGWSYWCGVVAAMILIVNGALMMVISFSVYRKRGGFIRKK